MQYPLATQKTCPHSSAYKSQLNSNDIHLDISHVWVKFMTIPCNLSAVVNTHRGYTTWMLSYMWLLLGYVDDSRAPSIKCLLVGDVARSRAL